MQAQEYTLENLLINRRILKVPNFQRSYRWRREEWQQLWDDIIREAEYDRPPNYDNQPSGHFLGSLVLHPSSAGSVANFPSWDIVDGQQRITTLTIIASCLRDVIIMECPEMESSAEQIVQDLVFLRDRQGKIRTRLEPAGCDLDDYVATVSADENGVGGYALAYNFFRDKLVAYITDKKDENVSPKSILENLDMTIRDRIVVVEIQTTTNDSVNTIFNTLNSTGLELSQCDLVKNFIFLKLDEEQGEEVYEKYWKTIENALVERSGATKYNDKKLVSFLWATELVYTPKVTKRNLFSEFERRSQKPESSTSQKLVLDHIKALNESLDIYCGLLEESAVYTATNDVKESISALRRWGSEMHHPISLLLLSLLRSGKVSDSETVHALEIVRSFLIRRALAGAESNNLNRLLSPFPSLIVRNLKIGVPPSSTLIKGLSVPSYRWLSDEVILNRVKSEPIGKLRSAQIKHLLSLAYSTANKREVKEFDNYRTIVTNSLKSFDNIGHLVNTLGNYSFVHDNRRRNIVPIDNLGLEDKLLTPELNTALDNADSKSVEQVIEERSKYIAQRILDGLIQPPNRRNDADESTRNISDLEEVVQTIPAGYIVDIETLSRASGMETEAIYASMNSLSLAALFSIAEARSGSIYDYLDPAKASALRNQLSRRENSKLSSSTVEELISFDDLISQISTTDESSDSSVVDEDFDMQESGA